MRLLLATHNEHKRREFARLLAGYEVDVLPDEDQPHVLAGHRREVTNHARQTGHHTAYWHHRQPHRAVAHLGQPTLRIVGQLAKVQRRRGPARPDHERRRGRHCLFFPERAGVAVLGHHRRSSGNGRVEPQGSEGQ